MASSLPPASYVIGPDRAASPLLVVRDGERRAPDGARRRVSLIGPRDPAVHAAAFARVARAFRRIDHPAVARIVDVVELDGSPFAVTVPLSGATLHEVLAQETDRPLGAAVIVHLVRGAAAGLAALRAAGLLDGGHAPSCTPAQVWVSAQGDVLLLPGAPVADAAVRGAPQAAAARQAGPGDEGADVRALGAFLWSLVDHGRCTLTVSSGEEPGVDPRLRDLSLRAMSASAARRPGSARALAEALSALRTDEREARRALIGAVLQVVAQAPGVTDPPATGRADADVVVPPRPEPPRARRRVPAIGVVATAGAALRVLTGPRSGVRLVLRGRGPWTVGRAASTDLPLPDPDLSREHAEIARGPAGELRAYDLGSKNGVLLNGAPADDVELSAGDELLLGATRLRVEA